MADSPTISLWAATVPSLIGLASGVATALISTRATIRAEMVRGSQAYEREQEARIAARRDAQLQRRNETQRELLINLQDVVHDLMRHTSAMHLADRAASRKMGMWSRPQLPEDLNQMTFETRALLTKLVVRVRDEEMRRLIQELRVESVKVGHASSENESEAYLSDTVRVYETLNERIGATIRKLEEPDIFE